MGDVRNTASPHSARSGRLRAFLGLAHSVIVYRTTLPAELMQEFRDAGVRLIFEFDDLVVGPDALENSGIDLPPGSSLAVM